MSLVDDLGRPLSLAAAPRRIVSLVPSLTELVCDLGCGERLVAVTRYCTEPAAVVAGLPKVGGTKTPDLEALGALRPDLVLLNAEENRREDLAALAAAGLPVFVSFPRTVAETVAAVARLGAALHAPVPAGALAVRIEAALTAARPAALARVRVFCPIWRRPWMSFNADTYAHDVLAVCGGDNVCAASPERYPRVELGDVAAADPEVVLLPDEPYPFADRHRSALGALRTTGAWRDQRIHLVDGKALSWYGRRTITALPYFRGLLHPA
jgi:ABC-type Fe3+-hydroxamate transport system substrate-binding protein